MNESKIAVRYAKALYELAAERNTLDKVRADMELISESIRTVPEFASFLDNPVIRTSQKLKSAQSIFHAKIGEISFSFVSLVFRNKRECYMGDICRNFFDLYKKGKGIKTVQLTLAVEADDKFRKNIIDTIKKNIGSEIELHEKINDKIIGGFILRIDDNQYNCSIAHKLKKIKTELLQS